MNAAEQAAVLRSVLAAGHPEQYATEAEFRHAVDQLARWLPAMVDGLALASASIEADRAAFTKRLMDGLDLPPELRTVALQPIRLVDPL